VGSFKGKFLSEVRDRYAETIKQLSSSSLPSQLIVLQTLLPIAADIIQHEERGEPTGGVCEAISHLVDANGSNVVAALVEHKVLDALIDRLASGRYGLHECVRALAFVTSCCNESQVEIVLRAVKYIQAFMVGTPEQPVRAKLFTEASLFVAMLCKQGEHAIEQVMTQAPGAMSVLFHSLLPHSKQEYNSGRVNTTAANSALALMYAAQYSSTPQLAILLEEGIFVMAFKTLLTFDYIPNLALQALKALRRIINKVTNITDSVAPEDNFQAERHWAVVKRLADAGATRVGSVGDEDDPLAKLNAKVQKYAAKLYECGAARGLIPAA
jgi:hypothetical protein